MAFSHHRGCEAVGTDKPKLDSPVELYQPVNTGASSTSVPSSHGCSFILQHADMFAASPAKLSVLLRRKKKKKTLHLIYVYTK